MSVALIYEKKQHYHSLKTYIFRGPQVIGQTNIILMNCICLWFLLFVGLLSSSFVIKNWKRVLLGWDQVIDLKNIPFMCPEKHLVSFCSKYWVILPFRSEAFCWVWAEGITLYTSEFILMLPSAVKSFNIHQWPSFFCSHPLCLTDRVLHFR